MDLLVNSANVLHSVSFLLCVKKHHVWFIIFHHLHLIYERKQHLLTVNTLNFTSTVNKNQYRYLLCLSPPDSIWKSLDFGSFHLKRNFKNVTKHSLQQILTYLCLLVNSANVLRSVSFLLGVKKHHVCTKMSKDSSFVDTLVCVFRFISEGFNSALSTQGRKTQTEQRRWCLVL